MKSASSQRTSVAAVAAPAVALPSGGHMFVNDAAAAVDAASDGNATVAALTFVMNGANLVPPRTTAVVEREANPRHGATKRTNSTETMAANLILGRNDREVSSGCSSICGAGVYNATVRAVSCSLGTGVRCNCTVGERRISIVGKGRARIPTGSKTSVWVLKMMEGC